MRSIAKRVSQQIKNSLSLLMVFALSYHANAQSFADLGTVWQKNDYTTVESYFAGISKQIDGTYLASGWIKEGGVMKGYIVHFNESGDKKNEFTAPLPSGLPYGYFNAAYFMDDGSILAVGALRHVGAIDADKTCNWPGHPDPANNDLLKYGAWFVKINSSTKAVTINRRDRGLQYGGAFRRTGADILLFGFDGDPNDRCNSAKISMIRVIGTDGGIKYDNYDGGSLGSAKNLAIVETNRMEKRSDGTYFVSGSRSASIISGSTFALISTIPTTVIAASSCFPTIGHAAGAVTHTYYDIFNSNSGGVFGVTNLARNATTMKTYGLSFFELNAAGTPLKCQILTPSSTLRTKFFHNLFPLPGSTTEYVGTLSNIGASTTYSMFHLKDYTGVPEYAITDGPTTPYNTIIRNTSHTDGFFSCGQDATTGRAAIVKLSTCANFKASPVTDIYVPYANSVNIAQAINYVGAKASAISGVKYTLQTKVLKGKVNNTAVGGILETVASTQVAGFTSAAGSASGKVLDLNRTYTLDPTLSDAEIEVTLTIQDNFLNGGQSQSCSQTYVFKIIISKASSTLFSDDVWFFGQNEGAVRGNNTSPGTPQTSKGIIFKKEGSVMKPYDASGISKVNSWENSLSVSTPACNGSFIFYTQHNQVYNTSHLPMDGGAFSGHTSTADGLAACYVGNNKYIMFSVTAEANTGTLKYYYIDMAANNGLGKMSAGGDVETNKVQEAIELIPKVGTTNQYWLLYFDVTTNKLKVKLIDGSQANPIGAVVSELPVVSEYTYSFTANTTWDKLLAVNTPNYFDVFDFNPLTGAVVKKYQKTDVGITNYSYGGTFSPDGKYLYVATYHATNTVRQYETSTGTLMGSAVFNNTALNMGSGMKLGPDGKIYINREERKWMAVIENPNIKFGTPGGGVTMDGFALTRDGYGLRPSTGLTPPWVNPSSTNNPPTATKDPINANSRYGTLVIKPLLNDNDGDGSNGEAKLNLNGASFVTATDASKGTLSWDPANKEVTFVPNPLHNFVNGEKIRINYIVKDVGIPVALCAEGEIEITWAFLIANNDIATALQKTPNNPIRVTLNDSIPVGCTPIISIVTGPTHGIASVSGSNVLYTPTGDYTGPDALTYKITCGAQTSTATVAITVIKLPDNISEADCFLKDPLASVWGIKEVPFSTFDLLEPLFTPLVGDINNDGKPEIIAIQDSIAPIMHVFGSDGTKIRSINLSPTYTLNAYGAMAMAKIKTVSGFKNMIYIAAKKAGSNVLLAYNYDDATFIWDKPMTGTTGLHITLNIADFNNDGYSEVAWGRTIHDAETGYQLCQGTGNSGYSSGWDGASKIHSMAVDVIGDSRLEVVAGNQVYDVVMNSRTNSALNSMTPIKTLTETKNLVCGVLTPGEGTIQVLDFNNDGRLDVVTEYMALNGTVAWIYVWDIETLKIIASTCISGVRSVSIPLVGDIDGDKKPEIVIMTSINGTNTLHPNDMMYAFSYDGSTNLVEKWKHHHYDASGATGITLFDFNQDGKYELVYRDEQNINIIDGSGSAPITKASFPCGSWTAYEYPVVADIDGDGSAEIITVGDKKGNRRYAAPLRVFKSSTSAWAPARPVWNQYAYNAINVNNDLTIPRHQLSPATVFPGVDGVLGTPDDVRPYNAFLQQQTTLNKNGTPLWLAPQAEIRKQPAFNYDVAKDSMTISVTVHNIGDAAFQNPFKITAYKDIVGGTPKHTYSYAGVINAGDSAVITFGIPKFKLNWTPFTDIIIRANDKGNGYNDQLVCDSMKRDFKTGTVIASDDRVLVFGNLGVNKIPVLKNDIYPVTCTSSRVSILKAPKQGTATVVNDSIRYTPNAGYKVNDTLRYRLTCDGKTSDATVYIRIGDKPDNIIDPEACVVIMPTIDFKVKEKWRKGGVHRMSSTLVGDLDGDGIAEIAAYGNVDDGNNNILIFDGSSGILKGSISIPTIHQGAGWRPAIIAVMVDADRNGWGEIIVARSDLNIMSYEASITAGMFSMKAKWASYATYSNPPGTDKLPHPNVADLNGDGVPELIVNNKVYNAVTGAYLGETEPIATANIGRIPLQNSNKSSNFQSVADIDGDGLLEIIAGGKIYKPLFNAAKTSVSFTFIENATIGDGFTSVVDVDLDGNLDVVVAKAVSASATHLYIWSPTDNRMIDNFQIASAGGFNGVSFPFVGDIDGLVDPITNKKYPEICINSVYNVFAYKYNSTTKKYSKKWTLPTSDESGATGIVLFDFNNDGINELVYRDQTMIRILNGVQDNVLPTNLASFGCSSSTSFEYPSIADVDNDGSANIIVTCNPDIVVYESSTQPWAPTRKVWNQVNYEPLLINDDLTTPYFPLPKNAMFNGKYPYNGALIQVPIVDDDFDPVLLAPDPGATTSDISIERLNVSTARVWITISNHGAKSTNISLPVALYINNAAVVANKIASKQVGVGIAPGAKYKMYIDMPVSKLQVAQKIVVRIQDDGTKYPADGSYLDCNYTNNVVDKPIFYAVDDYVALFTNTTVSTPVFANDKRAACTTTPLSKFDTIPNSGLKQGSLVFSQASDTSFVYTSKSGVYTTDSVAYYIKCGADSAAAKVYYLQIKPNSQAYAACPGAVVTVGVNAITGVTFRWYTTASSVPVLVTGLTTTITKDASASQSVWVEAEYKGVKYPRIEVKVNLASGCGVTNPSGCAKDGTVIFKEDFDRYGDGLNPLSGRFSSQALDAGRTSYFFFPGGTTANDHPTFHTVPKSGYFAVGASGQSLTSGSTTPAAPLWNEYSLMKYVTGCFNISNTEFIYEHTTSDKATGRMMVIDASAEPGIFYKHEINNLCQGSNLYFSVWVNNLGNPTFLTDPNLKFILTNKTDNSVVAIYQTGSIAPGNSSDKKKWLQYGFSFDLPIGVSDIIMQIENVGVNTLGNDFALDDIEIRFCAPPLITFPAKDTMVCIGSDLDIQLAADFIDDGAFGANVDYRWEFKASKATTWTVIATTVGSSANGKVTIAQSKYGLTSITDAAAGEYRFVVAASGNINSVNCRAVSENFHVLVAPPVRATDIRVQVCPDATPGANLNLSSYLYVIHPQLDWNVKWRNVSATPYSPAVSSTDPKGGVSLAFTSGTHTYKYKMENKCGVDSARVYITSLNKSTIQMPPQRVVICKDMAENIHINQILGVEARGVITSNLTPVIANDHILNVTSPSPFAGAVVFNGKTAYNDIRIVPIPYKGDNSATRVVFTYTANNASCLTQKVYTVELIITTNILN